MVHARCEMQTPDTCRKRKRHVQRSTETTPKCQDKVTIILDSYINSALDNLGWKTIAFPEVFRTGGEDSRTKTDTTSAGALLQGVSRNELQPKLVC
jgi:hypothetical protein